MNLLRAFLFLGAIAVAVAVAFVTFGGNSGQTNPNPQPTAVDDAALAAKAQDHCWFNVKSRSNLAKAAAHGPALSSTGAGAQRLGDLILVTGAIEPAVGDDRFYGCALYEYTGGSPVVVATKTSASPLRADALVPLGFTADGRKQ